VALFGPTGSGKSRFALELAACVGGEIITCDSVQLYQGFDIGSAKPSHEDQSRIPHHLLDEITWADTFDANQYRQLARKKITEVYERGKVPLVVGGSGLYLRALIGDGFHDLPSDPALRQTLNEVSDSQVLYQQLVNLDPERAQALHPNDRFRVIRALEVVQLSGRSFAACTQSPEGSIWWPTLTLQMALPAEKLERQISLRMEAMLQGGWMEEVHGLLKAGCPATASPMESIGYKQVVAFLQGRLSQVDMREEIRIATRRYAKKQLTWAKLIKPHFLLHTVSYPSWRKYFPPLWFSHPVGKIFPNFSKNT